MSTPKEPGEIGWPANYEAPGDPSLVGVATAAPSIVEGVLKEADGSDIKIVKAKKAEKIERAEKLVEVSEKKEPAKRSAAHKK
jgi:hypothetical protein